jgi:hypothetical protein
MDRKRSLYIRIDTIERDFGSLRAGCVRCLGEFALYTVYAHLRYLLV